MKKYYGSLKAYINDGGSRWILNGPCAGPNASVSGMRKLFWGNKCTIVRVGAYIYLHSKY